jgi:hypothetical protein
MLGKRGYEFFRYELKSHFFHQVIQLLCLVEAKLLIFPDIFWAIFGRCIICLLY